MKESQYKNFSLSRHKKNWRLRKPNICQFELTFACDFHCLYCYSDCYNNPAQIKRELSTHQVKFILDKVYNAGCLWLCFSGGDPLKRKDFLEIYAYAKKKGFVIIIFTNLYSLTPEIADFLKYNPPFVIEFTLNSITKETFEEITQVSGSYEKTMNGLDMIIKREIPFKIKTMIIKNNFKELPEIENFVRKLGLRFNATAFIQARLNKDTTPCLLRVDPEELFSYCSGDICSDDCFNFPKENKNQKFNNHLFNCAAGSPDGISIDPFGRMFFCNCLREPSIDLLRRQSRQKSSGLSRSADPRRGVGPDAFRSESRLKRREAPKIQIPSPLGHGASLKQEINHGLLELFPKMRERTFTKNSLCGKCQIRQICRSCPGKAFLEKNDLEAHLSWFCEFAHLATGKKYQSEPLEQAVESYV